MENGDWRRRKYSNIIEGAASTAVVILSKSQVQQTIEGALSSIEARQTTFVPKQEMARITTALHT